MPEPTSEQKAILDWIQNPGTAQRHAMVNAKAGTGKSHTLLEGSELISGRSVFLAFNKSIATELDEKLQSRAKKRIANSTDARAMLAATPMRAMTIHSLGYKVLKSLVDDNRPFIVDNNKYNRLARKKLKELNADEKAPSYNRLRSPNPRLDVPTLAAITAGLIEKSIAVRIDTSSDAEFKDVMLRYELYTSHKHRSVVIEAARLAIAEGREMVRRSADSDPLLPRIVAPSDMLSMPLELSQDKGDWPDAYTFDWIFVDEAQDLSAAQRELVVRASSEEGRMLFVGDPAQAINGFTGARSTSFQEIKSMIGATEFMLTGCFRCPHEHIKHAQHIVREIESRVIVDDAYRGKYGDEPICESLASREAVIDKIVALTDTDIPCVIARRKTSLKAFKEAVEKHNKRPQKSSSVSLEILRDPRDNESERELAESLLDHSAKLDVSGRPTQAALKKGCEAFKASLMGVDESERPSTDEIDRALALAESALEGSLPRDWQECKQRLWDSKLVATQQKRTNAKPIRVLTAHRSKGLEASHVFILDADSLASKPPQTLSPAFLLECGFDDTDNEVIQSAANDSYQQEWHLLYVALTRSKNGLYWTGGSPLDAAERIPNDVRARIESNRAAVDSAYNSKTDNTSVQTAEAQSSQLENSNLQDGSQRVSPNSALSDGTTPSRPAVGESEPKAEHEHIQTLYDRVSEIKDRLESLTVEMQSLKLPVQPKSEDVAVFERFKSSISAILVATAAIGWHTPLPFLPEFEQDGFIGAENWRHESDRGLRTLQSGHSPREMTRNEALMTTRGALADWLVFLHEQLSWQRRACNSLDQEEKFRRLYNISEVEREIAKLVDLIGLRLLRTGYQLSPSVAWNISDASFLSSQTSEKIEVISDSWLLGTVFFRRGYAIRT